MTIIMLLVLVLLMAVGAAALNTGGTPVVADEATDKAWCFSTRKKFDIQPGKSFGTLPKGEQHVSEVE